MSSVIKIDPEIMHGTPCFAGTRVPIQSLFDHLGENYSIEEFIEEFPTIKLAAVVELLGEFAAAVPLLAKHDREAAAR